jgi:hypothetical protein
MDQLGRFGRELVAVLKNHPILVAGLVLTLALGYFFGRNDKADTTETIAVVAMLVCVFLISVAVDIGLYLKEHPQNEPALSDENTGSRKVDTLIDGLELLLKTVDQRVPKDTKDKHVLDRRHLVLWRILPTEITTAMVRERDDESKELIERYLALSGETIGGGEIDVDFWDETIVGHLPTNSGRAKEYNQATWDFVKKSYFSEIQPDTTCLGLNPNLPKEWIIIVCTSSNRSDEPDDYICALKLFTGRSETIRPSHGEFFTDRHAIVKCVNDFKEMREQLKREDKYWYIIDLTLDEWHKAEKIAENFILNGVLASSDASAAQSRTK